MVTAAFKKAWTRIAEQDQYDLAIQRAQEDLRKDKEFREDINVNADVLENRTLKGSHPPVWDIL